MSAVAPALACSCGSIGAPKEIRLCVEHHRYWLGDARMESVSSVIRRVFPTDYSAVDPVVLETARLRGQFIDTYFSEFLTDPGSVIEPKYVAELVAPMFPRDQETVAADTVQRIERLLNWWEKSKLKAVAVQSTVFSQTDGIAGTFDFATEETIYDMKCVSSLQPAYKLQLGAYSTMDDQLTPIRKVAILHVTKDKVRVVPYDANLCCLQWRACVNWYRTMKELQ